MVMFIEELQLPEQKEVKSDYKTEELLKDIYYLKKIISNYKSGKIDSAELDRELKRFYATSDTNFVKQMPEEIYLTQKK